MEMVLVKQELALPNGNNMRKKVSCHVITYNHINYIKQCLDGIIMQKTDFDFEIIIGDDLSTDGTREVVQEYSLRYPDLIKLNLRNQRGIGIPGKENFVTTLEMCDGEFVALCDGDDYWTDPLKLQKQIDFLEANKDYSICFHNVDIKYENNIVPFLIDSNRHTKETTDLYDLLRGNYIHTPSVVFRNHKDLPDWFETAYPGDWPLHIINATYGKIKFLSEKMASYRVHSGGVHSTTDGYIEKSFDTFNDIVHELEKRGLKKEAETARIEYKKRFARYYGFSKSPNVNFSRFKKSKLVLQSGDPKLKAFFWLPLLFNNFSNEILKTVLTKIRK
jgi:glycosyltransferase involved in cell wall biosynthesis